MIVKTIAIASLTGLLSIFAIANWQGPQESNRGAQKVNSSALPSTRIRSSEPVQFPTNKSDLQDQTVDRSRSSEFGNWTIGLKNSEILSGDLLEIESLTIQTHYGKVTVKLDDVVCCHWVTSEKIEPKLESVEFTKTLRPVIVATVSGDIFSGACEFDSPKVNLHWGESKIKIEQIEFITSRKHGNLEIAEVVSDNQTKCWTLQPTAFSVHQSIWRAQSNHFSTRPVRHY